MKTHGLLSLTLTSFLASHVASSGSRALAMRLLVAADAGAATRPPNLLEHPMAAQIARRVSDPSFVGDVNQMLQEILREYRSPLPGDLGLEALKDLLPKLEVIMKAAFQTLRSEKEMEAKRAGKFMDMRYRQGCLHISTIGAMMLRELGFNAKTHIILFPGNSCEDLVEKNPRYEGEVKKLWHVVIQVEIEGTEYMVDLKRIFPQRWHTVSGKNEFGKVPAGWHWYDNERDYGRRVIDDIIFYPTEQDLENIEWVEGEDMKKYCKDMLARGGAENMSHRGCTLGSPELFCFESNQDNKEGAVNACTFLKEAIAGIKRECLMNVVLEARDVCKAQGSFKLTECANRKAALRKWKEEIKSRLVKMS